MTARPVTTHTLRTMKREGKKISSLTAYDYPIARMLDEAGVDVILVGDSLGMVVLGYDSTLPVTVEEIIHHTKAVARGVSRALLVADLPFLSYQVSRKEAVRAAGRMLKEGGAASVKAEGGRDVADKIKAILAAGIPVMGHLGLTPQSVHRLGGYKVQGRDAKAALAMAEDALRLQDMGCFAVVLECVPWQLGRMISESLEIPTIGIGAGPHCDGQVLVTQDMLGIGFGSVPKHVKQYARLQENITGAVHAFVQEVGDGKFPGNDQSFTMEDSVMEAVRAAFPRR